MILWWFFKLLLLCILTNNAVSKLLSLLVSLYKNCISSIISINRLSVSYNIYKTTAFVNKYKCKAGERDDLFTIVCHGCVYVGRVNSRRIQKSSRTKWAVRLSDGLFLSPFPVSVRFSPLFLDLLLLDFAKERTRYFVRQSLGGFSLSVGRNTVRYWSVILEIKVNENMVTPT